jgi:hypothetical protein
MSDSDQMALADELEAECVVRENHPDHYDADLTKMFRRCADALRRPAIPHGDGLANSAICKVLCQSGKFETGQGTCALICMDQLGDARKKGCNHAATVYDKLAGTIIEAIASLSQPAADRAEVSCAMPDDGCEWPECSCPRKDSDQPSPAKTVGREDVKPVAVNSREHNALRENLREAWSALAMIRETVETLGPVGAVKASEHLDGPTFMHEAEALVVGIAAALPVPPLDREGIARKIIEQCAKVADWEASRENLIFEQAADDGALSDTGRIGIQDRALARNTLAKSIATAIRALSPAGGTK